MFATMADDAPSSTSRRRILLLIGMATLVTAAIALGVWATQSHNGGAGASNDCGVVGQLGSKWTKMQHSVAALENGAGETKDLLAIADAESSMADEIRAAQASVKGPDLKMQLGEWAEGTALTAKGQRAAALGPAGPPSGLDNDSVRAATLTYNATAALRRACPQLQLPQAR